MNDASSDNAPDWRTAVVRAHQAHLERYAYSLCGQSEMARDAVQETFLRLVRADRKQIEPRMPGWLFTVCRSRIYDAGRKEGRMSGLSMEEMVARPDPMPGPAQRSERHEALAFVLTQVDRLPPAQREVVRLKFQAGLSYKEIAAVTEKSVSNVGALLSTAVRRLREQMLRTTDLLTAGKEPKEMI